MEQIQSFTEFLSHPAHGDPTKETSQDHASLYPYLLREIPPGFLGSSNFLGNSWSTFFLDYLIKDTCNANSLRR